MEDLTLQHIKHKHNTNNNQKNRTILNYKEKEPKNTTSNMSNGRHTYSTDLKYKKNYY